MAQNICGSTVNFRVSSPALFVMETTGITDAGQYETVTDSSGDVLVCCEPGNRSNGARNKEESIGILVVPAGQKLSQKRCDGQPGKIVVGERWVAGVTGNQNLID